MSKFRSGSVGVGIGGMRQRVAELDGEMRLENTNPGTLVETVFPIKLAMGVSSGRRRPASDDQLCLGQNS